MTAPDVAPTRADAALAAMRAFIAQAPPGTKIAIVAFAAAAQIVLPLTGDRDQTRAAFQAIPPPNGGTAIGDALETAKRSLPSRGHRVVVLITDGVNNTGQDPLQAARDLGAVRIPLYTIGIGTNSGALVPGTLQIAGIDEDALRSYAAATGGAYSRAADAGQLREALARLGRTTTFERRNLDISLFTAIAAGVLMAIIFLAGIAAGRYP